MGAEFSGILRDRIRIERTVAERDSIASGSVETEFVGAFWAAMEAQATGWESVAESRSALQQWRVTLRQTNDILPGDWLIWSGRKMLVRSVAEDRRLLPKTILHAEEIR